MRVQRRTLLGISAALPIAGMTGAVPVAAKGPILAERPPMGWNSFNSFATNIVEAEALETAAIMARELLPFGYDTFTIDHQWYEPKAIGYDVRPKGNPTLDAHGRLIPAPARFPSSAGSGSFKPLADAIHKLGLRFGLHLMRGIPRLAVERNLPILGTRLRARDIADTSSICSWNQDMYGVDMRRPGAQAYYDGVFALFAEWGVDFVKMDDMSRPYDAHAAEIEAAALAIRRSGRPMVLSLSPGETPVIRAEHVRKHAQMWRISDDFWDEWPLLEAQFVRFENWNPHRRPGGWPDGDMLPLGRLRLGARDTRFTPDEQRTLMTLWAITRSPLIMGGDLRRLDAATLALLTNREVIAVNQASSGNQPHFVEDYTRVWSARAPGGGRYVALFNTGKGARDVGVELSVLGLAGRARVRVRDLWVGADDGVATGRLVRSLPSHGAGLYWVG
ncbi:glycoside hydrolase family 27 protein [Sphingomonas sp.]|uniref:glycoside hydrolase family 27 protein n=1 Tax=Sphingomonas sp. TaxID=28214 RepID=UPI002ED8A156